MAIKILIGTTELRALLADPANAHVEIELVANASEKIAEELKRKFTDDYISAMITRVEAALNQRFRVDHWASPLPPAIQTAITNKIDATVDLDLATKLSAAEVKAQGLLEKRLERFLSTLESSLDALITQKVSEQSTKQVTEAIAQVINLVKPPGPV